jgi:hypothetical protein
MREIPIYNVSDDAHIQAMKYNIAFQSLAGIMIKGAPTYTVSPLFISSSLKSNLLLLDRDGVNA